MSITTENSTEYANQIADPVVKQAPSVLSGRVRVAKFTHTQTDAGDAGSLTNLIRLPAGNIRILQIRISHTDHGSSRTLDLGYAANVDVNGDAVIADPNAFADGIDVNNTTDIDQHVDSTIVTRDGLIVTAQINDGTFQANATLNGIIQYVLD